MPERPVRRHLIANQLLQLSDFREATVLFAGPDALVVYPYFENAASARVQAQFPDLAFECCQQLLRHPGGAQKPTATGAVVDINFVAHGRINPCHKWGRPSATGLADSQQPASPVCERAGTSGDPLERTCPWSRQSLRFPWLPEWESHRHVDKRS